MNETFKWGGHLPIIIVLLTMLTPKLLQMPRCMYQMGGIAIIVVSAPLLFVFGAPIVQLQVCRCSRRCSCRHVKCGCLKLKSKSIHFVCLVEKKFQSRFKKNDNLVLVLVFVHDRIYNSVADDSSSRVGVVCRTSYVICRMSDVPSFLLFHDGITFERFELEG